MSGDRDGDIYRLDAGSEKRAAKITSGLSRYTQVLANEPSLGLYRVQAHVLRSTGELVATKKSMNALRSKVEGSNYDAEFGILAVRDLQEINTFDSILSLVASATRHADEAGSMRREFRATGRRPPPSVVAQQQPEHQGINGTRVAVSLPTAASAPDTGEPADGGEEPTMPPAATPEVAAVEPEHTPPQDLDGAAEVGSADDAPPAPASDDQATVNEPPSEVAPEDEAPQTETRASAGEDGDDPVASAEASQVVEAVAAPTNVPDQGEAAGESDAGVAAGETGEGGEDQNDKGGAGPVGEEGDGETPTSDPAPAPAAPTSPSASRFDLASLAAVSADEPLVASTKVAKKKGKKKRGKSKGGSTKAAGDGFKPKAFS